jgi:hypothetical protein
MSETVVIAGSMAQKPGQGGATWVLLQYVLGFKRLGWEVLFLDRLEPGMCFTATRQPSPLEQSFNLQYFLNVMERFGLNRSFALAYNRGEQWIGLSRPHVLERVRNCRFFLNVMGYFEDQEILGCASTRVLLDIDPGFGQMWHEMGLADLFDHHDRYVTIGENIGSPDCSIPTCGLTWITTRQPIVLDYWTKQPQNGSHRFSSVASWRGAYGPLEYRGKKYGLRVHEFRKFAQLPRLSGCPFELALEIHPTEVNDIHLLTTNGWSLVDPKIAVSDPWKYQAYIQKAGGEFMVAKNMYVDTHSGWFSDRSICYLASGKPVLAQDTGIKQIYSSGKGLVIFTTLEEALAGVKEISGNYVVHSKAARELAEEYFDSKRVLSALVAKLDVSTCP